MFKDGPKFSEEVLEKQLTEVDYALIGAYVHYLNRTMPKDEVLEEMLRPFVIALTKDGDQNNWLIQSKGLLHRSRNEFQRTKTIEKSIARSGASWNVSRAF